MSRYKITCPYCFAEFPDTAVHFRMETYFNENNLNDEGLTIDEVMKKPDTAEFKQMKAITRNRAHFIYKDDETYTNWWKKFGGTSEIAAGSDKDLECEVYQLPVLDPGKLQDQDVLKELNHNATGSDKFFEYDADGMVSSIIDIFGNRTRRRVCPKCHNPLPLHYGKNPVKFISVIGVTSSGKTVYISQLLKHLNSYCAIVNISANIMATNEAEFIDRNKVEMEVPLPGATDPGHMEQPMFYAMLQEGANEKIVRNNVVIYDIAGETFSTLRDLEKYGQFVAKSSGIIFIVDPKQLNLVQGQMQYNTQPEIVLNMIHTAFFGENSKEKCKIPLAVCVSKSDIFARELNAEAASCDIKAVKDERGQNLSLFNATDYNTLQPHVKDMVGPLETNVRIQYTNYNYFTFSATGSEIEEREAEKNGKITKEYYLKTPPSPKRIAEPMLWLFHQFGYIKSDIPIRLPRPREEKKIFVGYEKQKLLDKVLGKEPKEIWRDMTPEEKKALDYEPQEMAMKPI